MYKRKFEVLCVTMEQNDFSLYNSMKLNSDTIFANQTNKWDLKEDIIDNHSVKMYYTDTKGVGNNRNIALMNADAEICLLADDDIVYRSGYEEKIIEAFDSHPDADAIIFNISTTTPEYGRNPTVIKRFRRLHLFDRNPYGAPRIAFRTDSIKKANISFSVLFGGGSTYIAGEDTIFITEFLRKGLKVYLSPIYIGDVSYAKSSSFSFDIREILYNRGALLAGKGGKMKFIYLLYYSFFCKNRDVSKIRAFKLILNGMEGYKRLRTYSQYIQEER